MKVDIFDFELPRECIATRPAVPREAARLLTVGPAGFSDAHVRDLPSFLEAGDILVFNDTRVIKARLRGRKGEGKVEVTLHRRLGEDRWLAFARPAKKLKTEDHIVFSPDLGATVAGKGEGGEVELHFSCSGPDLWAAIARFGELPLPPYIAGQRPVDAADDEDYQTMFAAREGAVAAPTAGLHFTPALLEALEARGVLSARLTLHVGAGTFLPVKAGDTADHRMHGEWGSLTADVTDAINGARAAGGRIVAVGTTCCRLLESAADDRGRVHAFEGETSLFITPGYRFKAVDLLMSNFHLPRSTLFMLVSAFSGLERMQAAYAHARDNGYRFYSYGDATLLYPEAS
jgi:S-adenosylmethionine:tRNA ribosyltransferase-isomerase